jgi:hypothetical protein
MTPINIVTRVELPTYYNSIDYELGGTLFFDIIVTIRETVSGKIFWTKLETEVQILQFRFPQIR